MRSVQIAKDVSFLFLDKMGVKVSQSEEVGVCSDGRVLYLQKDKFGAIIGLELV